MSSKKDAMRQVKSDLHNTGDSDHVQHLLAGLEDLRSKHKLTRECIMQLLILIGGAGIVSVEYLCPSLVERIRGIMDTIHCRGCGLSVDIDFKDSTDAIRVRESVWCCNRSCHATMLEVDFASTDPDEIKRRYDEAAKDV